LQNFLKLFREQTTLILSTSLISNLKYVLYIHVEFFVLLFSSECVTMNCAQRCIATGETVQCGCFEGYRLDEDGITCNGKSSGKFLNLTSYIINLYISFIYLYHYISIIISLNLTSLNFLNLHV